MHLSDALKGPVAAGFGKKPAQIGAGRPGEAHFIVQIFQFRSTRTRTLLLPARLELVVEAMPRPL